MLRDCLEQNILSEIPQTEMNGDPDARLQNTTNISFGGIESEALLLLLDQQGICASSGSACLADSEDPSHVIRAMKPESDASRQMIRFSLGEKNTQDEITETIMAVKQAVSVLRE